MLKFSGWTDACQPYARKTQASVLIYLSRACNTFVHWIRWLAMRYIHASARRIPGVLRISLCSACAQCNHYMNEKCRSDLNVI